VYTYEQLTTETSPRYAGLTFPRYRNVLKRTPLLNGLIAIGAAYMGVPVGLILGGVSEQNDHAEILSLSTVPSHRGKGIAQQLLSTAVEQLKARGCQQVDLYYVNGKPTTPALERILEKGSWTPPQPITIIAHSDMNHVREKLINLEYPLPEEAEIFAWHDLTDADRSEIEQREQQPGGWYTNPTTTFGLVSPFIDIDRIDQSSVGVRFRGKVVGWMITHRISPQSIRYTSLFVSSEVRQHNLGIMLILKALKRQDAHWQATGEAPKGYFQALVENRWMRQFIQMSAPLWLQVDEYNVTSKSLGEGLSSLPIQSPRQMFPDSYADASLDE
jgi:GNAT superfamily N-acetyltransferase